MTAANIIHQSLISVLLFTLWAAFALLIINPGYQTDLPKYIIGKLCVWDYSAMILAILGSFIMTKYWGYPEIGIDENQKKLIIDIRYAYFLLSYFLVGMILAIWQFWLFSQKF